MLADCSQNFVMPRVVAKAALAWRVLRRLLPPAAALLLSAAPSVAVDFQADIRPLLQKHCTECHGAEKQKSGLRLDAKIFAFKGGDDGAVIIPGDSAKSPLYQRIVSTDADERMPPKGERLTSAEAAMVKTWLDAGALWPESDADRAAAIDKRLQHWAWQPVKVAPDAGSSIDAFIDAKLRTAGLARSPEADPRTLIRRMTFDVTGLPPSPEEVEAFVREYQTQAAAHQPTEPVVERLVDRLLASPRFGEKWARHWLDVVRFAESDGFEMNHTRPNAWPYRDYVIRAFNEDKPYDQFVREQIAGDASGADAATGFLVGGATDLVTSKDPVLTANQRADELHDMVSTTAATFLGLTLNCARCHDHKFDPIPTQDYYGMVALLQGVRHGERPLPAPDSPEARQHLAASRAELASVEQGLAPFRPHASLERVVLLDDSASPSGPDKAGVTSLVPPANGSPIAYSPGQGRGAADDPGDVARLPNLGESYRYWSAKPGAHENLFSWDPRLTGRFRLWVSWAAWTTHTKDARYVLDLDGNPATKSDQVEIARADQSAFADGAPAIPNEKRWSGFRDAGVHALTPVSIVLLRGGDSGGPTIADLLVFEEVTNTESRPTSPHLRPPVTHLTNEEVFAPVQARFVRFTVTATSGAEPCLDELEVFSSDAPEKNLARGAQVQVSGTYANGANPKHQARHLNDGRYGNDASWISNESGKGWAQLEFARTERIQRIVWSRDRGTDGGRVYDDRRATGYRIEISLDGAHWQTVASSDDRLGQAYRPRITSLPTLSEVPSAQIPAVAALNARRAQLEKELAARTARPLAYAGRFEAPGETHRFQRGDPMQPREVVEPATLSLIGTRVAVPLGAPEQQRRLALANWIADARNPLTARVIVNRLWHYHFGTGLVDTPSDFGLNGSRPSHPELLDWLANELITHHWSLKHLHRLILLSGAYRQSSAASAAGLAADSGARLLWRFPPRRFEAETVRDTMLAVSGKLDLTMGGPGFDLFEPNDNYVKLYTTRANYGPAEFRRMVYQSKPRTMLDDIFGAFDCPDAGQPAPKRTSSTTPLQALNLLNSSFAVQQGGFFAERLRREVGPDAAAQVNRAFQLAFGRVPSAEELADSTAFIAHDGLPAFCRALFNANEFLRLD